MFDTKPLEEYSMHLKNTGIQSAPLDEALLLYKECPTYEVLRYGMNAEEQILTKLCSGIWKKAFTSVLQDLKKLQASLPEPQKEYDEKTRFLEAEYKTSIFIDNPNLNDETLVKQAIPQLAQRVRGRCEVNIHHNTDNTVDITIKEYDCYDVSYYSKQKTPGWTILYYLNEQKAKNMKDITHEIYRTLMALGREDEIAYVFAPAPKTTKQKLQDLQIHTKVEPDSSRAEMIGRLFMLDDKLSEIIQTLPQ